MTAIPGLQIPDKIVPFDSNDTHPTHDETYGLGGYRSVASVSARDAIPTDRRSIGMLVYVVGTNTTYQLIGGLTNASWVQYTTPATAAIYGSVTCNTSANTYIVSNSHIPGPSANITATLRIPSINSINYVCSVANVISGSFTLVLSDIPDVSGYLINWTVQNPS